MTSDIAISLAIVIGATILIVVSPVIYARYSGPRCPTCGIRPFDSIDSDVFYDPAPDWALYRCDQCGDEFIRDSNGFTPRFEWIGDPDAEEMFQSFEADNQVTT